MDSRKALFAILGGVVLSTVVGILLTPYKHSAKRKKIAEKVKDYTDSIEETIKGSVSNVKKQFEKMSEDADRMVNEGGNAV